MTMHNFSHRVLSVHPDTLHKERRTHVQLVLRRKLWQSQKMTPETISQAPSLNTDNINFDVRIRLQTEENPHTAGRWRPKARWTAGTADSGLGHATAEIFFSTDERLKRLGP